MESVEEGEEVAHQNGDAGGTHREVMGRAMGLWEWISNAEGERTSMEQLAALNSKMDRVAEKQDTFSVQLQELKSSMMPRAEIEAADARRVSVDTFDATMKGITLRLDRLENASARVLAWVAVAMSILSVALNVYLSLRH